MPHRKNFGDSIKTLNAQLWLLLTLCEHSAGQFSQMSSLDGVPHEKVVPAIFNYSKNHSKNIRLRNDFLCSDMVDLTKTTEKWLPAYFLILAKSIFEGILSEIFESLYLSDPQIKLNIDQKRKVKKRAKSRQIELIAQAIARGSFADVSDVLDIRSKLSNHATISATLNTYSKIRNKMGHNLNGHYKTKTPITVDELKRYVKDSQEVVTALT